MHACDTYRMQWLLTSLQLWVLIRLQPGKDINAFLLKETTLKGEHFLQLARCNYLLEADYLIS